MDYDVYKEEMVRLATTIARTENDQAMRDTAMLRMEQLQLRYDVEEKEREERERIEAEEAARQAAENGKKYVKFTVRVNKNDYNKVRDMVEESLGFGYDDDYESNEAILRALMAMGMATYITETETDEV